MRRATIIYDEEGRLQGTIICPTGEIGTAIDMMQKYYWYWKKGLVTWTEEEINKYLPKEIEFYKANETVPAGFMEKERR
jgi:hypothetical protein